MYVDASDQRPPSLLVRRPVDPLALVMGGVIAAGAHLVVPLVVVVSAAILTAIGVLSGATTTPAIAEREIVEARFVKLGRPFDPRRLPNRRVNVLNAQTPHGVAVSKNMNPTRPEREDAGIRDAREAEIAHIGTRAQLFAEIARMQEQEGNPDGIEEGTSDSARAGDLYAGQLYALFRRGWSTPTTIDRDELGALTCEVDVEISADAHVSGFRVRRPSGNALFDQSVLDRLQQIQDGGSPLPQPPADVASQYLGQTIGLRFRGRDAH